MEAIYLGQKKGVSKKSGNAYNMFFYACAGNGVNGLESKTAFMPSDFVSVWKPLQKVDVEFGPNNSVVGVRDWKA